MLIKTRGIIFKTFKYSETSVIAEVYTEEKGLRKYLISGVRSKKARVKASLLQHMSLVDLVAYEREDRDLHRIKEIKAAYVYQAIPFDLIKGTVGLFMVEVAQKTIREAEENRELFQFLYDTFCYLDQTPHLAANLHLHYLLELSVFLGIIPGGDFEKATPFFDLKEGLFVPDIPNHSHYVDEKNSALWYQFLQTNRENCHLIRLGREERRVLLNQLLEYYQLHIESLPPINAHQIIQQVIG